MNRFNMAKRGKVQVIQSSEPPGNEDVASPAAIANRRGSMKLTDFPTEVERPSLPVTPAPVRKHNFWGQERDEDGELPAADGVPKQQDWNPLKRLEELQRRQSEVLARGPISPTMDLPQRPMPETAKLVPTSEETETPQSSVSADPFSTPGTTTVLFSSSYSPRANDIEPDAASGADEGVFSPIET